MDAQRLIQMILRMVMRKGMNAGIDYVARGGKPAQALTPGERAQARTARDTAQRANQAARLMRRLGR